MQKNLLHKPSHRRLFGNKVRWAVLAFVFVACLDPPSLHEIEDPTTDLDTESEAPVADLDAELEEPASDLEIGSELSDILDRDVFVDPDVETTDGPTRDGVDEDGQPIGHVWYVNPETGSDAYDGTNPATAFETIAHALEVAEDGDTIQLSAHSFVGGGILVFSSVSLRGYGVGVTTLEGDGINNSLVEVLLGSVSISDLTFARSESYDGAVSIGEGASLELTDVSFVGCSGGGSPDTPVDTGAIGNAGELVATRIRVDGTQATGDVGLGIYNSVGAVSSVEDSVFINLQANTSGGAIFNQGTMTVTRSVFSDNSANSGGAITNDGDAASLTMENCTITDNTSAETGAAIYNSNSAVTEINNVTIAGNTSDETGSVIHNESGSITLTNTIVANPTSDNCFAVSSGGHNLSSDDSCAFDGEGDLANSEPRTAPLYGREGFVEILAISFDSPAYKSGDQALCPSLDQRGISRPTDGPCNMGSFESDVLIVSTDGSNDNDGRSEDTPLATLNAAIERVSSSEDLIHILPGSHTVAPIQITNISVIILGSVDEVERPVLTAEAGQGLLNVSETASVWLSNLTLTDGGGISGCLSNYGFTSLHQVSFHNCENTVNGAAARNEGALVAVAIDVTTPPDSTARGLEILAQNSTTYIEASTFSGLGEDSNGGAIYNMGTMEIRNSTFDNNQGSIGGAIYNAHDLTISDTTFDSNEAAQGGAIVNYGELNIYRSTFVNNSTGAIQNDSTLNIENSTFGGNISSGGGGASAVNMSNGQAHIIHTTFADNEGNVAIYVSFDTTAEIGNTIFSNGELGCGSGGELVSLGGNLDSGTSCGFSEVTDQNDTDSDLEALGSNGGPTQTHALPPTSPAVNSGLSANCLDTDQRGVVRPEFECDVGAFELEAE